jgi:adenine-specific DNA-methyltransferase
MAAINDLISQIDNKELRDRILLELEKMNKQKKFGLVFEEHLPESVKMFDTPVKKGSFVMEKTGGKNVYKVLSIADRVAECIDTTTQEARSLPISEIVSVALFGTPIYPYLKPIDSICNAPGSDLWHALIEADNYHALQLLEYMYAGKVDCIYIDPPYNTGARDWKYNNDYVDGTDSYRHSKWLSFMQRRLALAKKLLNPRDSVLIVTIDEKEYLHLGCLLEQMFPDARIQMISDVISSHGSWRDKTFARCDEFLYYVYIGNAGICFNSDDMLHAPEEKKTITWHGLIRSGKTGKRSARPNLFYPIFFNKETGYYVGIGEPLSKDMDRNLAPVPDGCFAVFPIGANGDECAWGASCETFLEKKKKGYIKFGEWTPGSNKRAVYFLQSGPEEDIKNGVIPVIGMDQEGAVVLGEHIKATQPMTVWNKSSHTAGIYGSSLLKSIIGDRFTFPKSVYSVHDALKFVVANKPNAVLLDFFAGSGTTLHAVNLLNEEDGGRRRCIMVTNNEVSDEESKNLKARGYQPGDVEWEQFGIAHYVTWPRTVCSIKGEDINGNPLKGKYISDKDIPMADGFKANAIFFKLGFLNHNSVKLGRQFFELLPVLWMKAGAIGPCPDMKSDNLPDWLILPENKFAVLIDDNQYHAFKQEMEKISGIDTLYIITDFEREYTIMAEELGIRNTFQLYRDYLDNFRINHSR